MLADQLLECIENIHNNGWLHCDIHARNVVIGSEEHSSHLFLIDFGLAEELANSGKTKAFDLEAIGEMLAYFLRGERLVA